MPSQTTKYLLPESEIPTHWVNLLPDLPGDPIPPLNPQTMQPAGPDDLTPIFPMALIGQEVSMDAGGRDPGRRCARSTSSGGPRRSTAPAGSSGRSIRPAHIYYKYEGVSPAGSHKPNSAVAQAYENKEAGIKRLATETGAGQWGSALALACQLFDLECVIYMVGASYDQKPYRRSMMETWGATGAPLAERHDRRRPLAGRPPHRLAGHRHLRGGGGGGQATTTPTTRSAPCSTTSACTRR